MRKVLATFVALASITVGGSILVATAATSASSPSLPPMRISRDDAREAAGAIIDDSPSSQREQLADGGVSLEEYRAAVDRARSCLDSALAAQGVAADVAEPRLSSDGYEFSYHYRVGPTPDGGILNPDLVSQLDRECRAEFLDATEDVYQLQARTDSRFTTSVRDRLAHCLDEVGIDYSAEGDARDLAASASAGADTVALEQVTNCLIDLPSVTDVVATEVDGAAGR